MAAASWDIEGEMKKRMVSQVVPFRAAPVPEASPHQAPMTKTPRGGRHCDLASGAHRAADTRAARPTNQTSAVPKS